MRYLIEAACQRLLLFYLRDEQKSEPTDGRRVPSSNCWGCLRHLDEKHLSGPKHYYDILTEKKDRSGVRKTIAIVIRQKLERFTFSLARYSKKKKECSIEERMKDLKLYYVKSRSLIGFPK